MATVTISGGTGDAGALGDDRPWAMWAAAYQPDGQGGVITTRDDRTSNVLRPVAGVLTFKVEAGIAFYLENPDKRQYLITAPAVDATRWDTIEASVAYPPDTDQTLLASAVGQYVMDNADQLVGVDGVQPSTDGTAVEFLRNDDVIGEVGFGNIFVRFVDQNGDPLPEGSLTTIHVNTVTGDIDDITFEEA